MALGSEWILDRFRHPEPAVVIEIDVDRLTDIRFGGDQLHFETRRQMKPLALFLRSPGIGLGDELGVWVFLGHETAGAGLKEAKCKLQNANCQSEISILQFAIS